MFDAGALIFRIQTIGADVFQRDMKGADQATKQVGKSASDSAKSTDTFGKSQDSAGRSTKSFATELGGLSAKGKDAAKTVGVGMLGVGAAVTAMVVGSVKKFADFDAQLAQVRTLSHATAGEMDELSDAALNMGQNIGLSANQVADAETELVKAGVSVTDQLGGALPGALNLAASGQIDVGKATQIAAVAMTQFKLAGKDVPHLADLLAAGADKALGGVDQLGQGLNQSGLVAAQFGLSIDDTVGSMAAFANAGLLGSDAGTSFKTMLLSLASPSAQANALLKQYNITAYDSHGAFVGIVNLAGQLHDKLGNVSQAERDAALSTIFGTDAIRTANVLYQEGAKGIQGWIDNVDDSGFAAEQAAGKMDSLNGDAQKLGAAWDTALIKTGSGANDVLRQMVQLLTGVVQWYAALPQPVQQAGLVLGVAAATAALFGGAMLLTVPKIIEFRVAMRTLSTEMPVTLARMKGVASFLTGPWGIALAAAAVGVHLLSSYLDSLQASSAEITN